MKVIGWRAWYVGGRKFDSKTTKWKDLPDDGVIQVMLFMDERARNNFPYRRGSAGADYYWYVPAEDVYGECTHGEMTPEEITRRYPGAIIKRGKWVSEEELAQVMKESAETRFL